MEEPSVLDYVKSKLFFWRKDRVHIPLEAKPPVPGSPDREQSLWTSIESVEGPTGRSETLPVARKTLFPSGAGWMLARLLVPIGLAVLAQRALEPPGRSTTLGVVLYLMAAVGLVWSNVRREWTLAPLPAVAQKSDPLTVKPLGLWVSLLLGLFSFLLFWDNLFTPFNLILWLFALAAFLHSFWLPDLHKPPWYVRVRSSWQDFLTRGISFSPWTLLVLAVFGISAFYRFYLLNQVPAEMFSDHAEKLLDVKNVLAGETNIFFPRNTGREAFQMYLTAAMALLFNTGLSFLSLKLGTAICGLLTLPFIYLLGVELANRRVGLYAMFFAGVAYWPNVISRVALRFTLYPTFTAPVLYFLVRALRRRNRNDFILAGLFLGIGLHGYSPFRFVPILVLMGVGLYLLHRQSQGGRRQAVWGLLILASSALLVFLPLLRYAISNPTTFGYRMMTRMGQVERVYPAPPLDIFFKNMWQALIMPLWDNGQVWVHSIPNRPALSVSAAVLFVFGVLLLALRYIRKRNWLDIFLLVSIPLLMMPSILSLAFPEENPSLNRTGGALIVVFLMVGLAFDGLLTFLKSRRFSPGGTWLAWGLAVLFVSGSAYQDYDLVFNQYAHRFHTNAWNTSELGAVIAQYASSVGAEDSAWVVPYPHWVDTRLVGIRAGFPERDYALWPEDIITTVGDPRAKMYLVKPEDTASIDLLRTLFPTGVLRLFESQMEGRDFYIYSVPPIE